jgi:hypothetical protein
MNPETKPEETKPKEIKMPVCPYCCSEMTPFHYRGYYDSFCGWECQCEKIPNAEIQVGEYA